jgi:hypothetical protein
MKSPREYSEDHESPKIEIYLTGTDQEKSFLKK